MTLREFLGELRIAGEQIWQLIVSMGSAILDAPVATLAQWGGGFILALFNVAVFQGLLDAARGEPAPWVLDEEDAKTTPRSEVWVNALVAAAGIIFLDTIFLWWIF